MAASVRVVTQHTKDDCPTCKGRGYFFGGVDGDVKFDCSHRVIDWRNILAPRVAHNAGWNVIQLDITETQLKELEEYLTNNGIQYAHVINPHK